MKSFEKGGQGFNTMIIDYSQYEQICYKILVNKERYVPILASILQKIHDKLI